MPDLDLFSAGAGAGFDEGWVEGSIDASVDVTGGVHASVCHGIDLGVEVGAAAEANAHLRVLVLGARGNVGAHARAGVRGQVTLDPNVFERFGLTARIEAAAEAAARARLEISLEAEYVAELAAQQLDGLALELFLAFLREMRVGGGVSGKIAYSAMARAWAQASGRLGDDDDAGFTIGGGYAVGLKGGYGLDWFINIGFDNPRRFFGTAVNLIVDEIVAELDDQLPPGSGTAIELFRLLAPAGLHAAYDVGQKSITQGISTPEEVVRPFLIAFAEELQRYLADKAAEYAARLIADLIQEAIVRLAGREVDAAGRQAVETAVQGLNEALGDGRFDPEDIDEVLALAFVVTDLAAPEMLTRFRRPASILWTAAAVGVALRDVGQLTAGGQISVLGVGVEARARIREMPPVNAMPDQVLQEYLQTVADFDGTALTFDHAMDYLVAIGVGPMMADHVPELAGLLDRLHTATGISPGNIVTFGIQGALGGPVTETELYVELKTFVRNAVDEVIRDQVFAAFDQVAGSNPDARLYMDEVARPSIELMVSFVFDQLDIVVDDPSVLGGLDYLSTLQSGLSALLYKIVARNIVVLEQIAADTVRSQAVGAFGALEQGLRDDDTHALMTATVDHIDAVLANVSDYVPLVPGASGLSDAQLAAIRIFAAEMLNIAQEALGDQVFTNARWNRRRQALLALLLSLDDHFDWGSDDLIAEAIDALKSCAFVPDEQAIQDLYEVHLDLLIDQANILLRRLPTPLSELVLALTAPQLEDLGVAATQFESAATETLMLAAQALETVRNLIHQAGELAAQAAGALTLAVTAAIDDIAGLNIGALRPAIVSRGQANLRDAGEALGIADVVLNPIVDGFGAVFDGLLGVFGGLIDPALDTVRDAAFIGDAIESAVSGIASSELVIAGSGSGFVGNAVLDFEDALVGAISSLFIPADGSDPDPGLTIVVPSPEGDLTAIGPADVAELVADAVLQLLDPVPLIGHRLEEAYQRALEAAHQAQEPGKASAVTAAAAELDGARARSGTQIEVYSPAPLEARPDRLFLYGPVIPLALQIRRAGMHWKRGDEAQRIQVAVNGMALQFPAAAWSYDAARERLRLDTALRIDAGHLRPGLNVVEVSAANAPGTRVRHSVEFLVDPDGPLPNDNVSIDADASQFDSPGSDHASVYEEYVALRWQGTGRLDMDGWQLRDRAGHRYVFGPTRIQSGQLLRLRSGGDPVDDNDSDRHWGRRRAVWNNNGDTVVLLDARQAVRAHYVYPGSR